METVEHLETFARKTEHVDVGTGVITPWLRGLAGFVEDDTFMFEPTYDMVPPSLSMSCDFIVAPAAYMSN